MTDLDRQEERFARFYEEEQTKVTNYFFVQLHDYERAEELCQEAFIRLYPHFAHLDARARNYLFRTTKNLVIDELRRRCRQVACLPLEVCADEHGELSFDAQDPETDPEQVLLRKERRAELRAQIEERLAELPPGMARVVWLTLEGKSSQEISSLVKMNVVTVRTRRAEATRRLLAGHVA